MEIAAAQLHKFLEIALDIHFAADVIFNEMGERRSCAPFIPCAGGVCFWDNEIER